jgi:hypothetical protein
MTLMLDSSWCYSYTDGLKVGQAIQDLGYHWYGHATLKWLHLLR